MSDDEQPAGDDVSVTARLWSVVRDLQDIRQQNEIDYRDERQLKSAIAEIENVRKSVRAERSDTDAGE